MTKTNQAQLEAWLREWQQTLRLQDWQVKIDLRREKAMEYEGCHGLNGYTTSLKQSRIQIRHPTDDHPVADYPQDVEATIVHELLHLHFAPFYVKKGLANTFQEQAIEVIARSLVELKRKGFAMAKGKGNKRSKGGATVPGIGGKPARMKPPGAKSKGVGKGKGGKAC